MTEEILKLIEAVDPSDSEKLDEIDARVWCLLSDIECRSDENDNRYVFFRNEGREVRTNLRPHYPGAMTSDRHWINEPEYYFTRSRDALKAIRPEAWILLMVDWSWKPEKRQVWQSEYSVILGVAGLSGSLPEVKSPSLPTEELAELHAIIQAIAHERGQS